MDWMTVAETVVVPLVGQALIPMAVRWAGKQDTRAGKVMRSLFTDILGALESPKTCPDCGKGCK